MKRILLLVVVAVLVMAIFVPVAFAADGEVVGTAPDWTRIIIAGVSLLFTAIIVPFVKAGFEWLKGKTQNEALLAALTEAQTVADNVVAGLQQNVVEGLKAKSTDGKLSNEDIKEVASLAFGLFKADISARSFAILMQNADSITEYVENLINARLLKLKNKG